MSLLAPVTGQHHQLSPLGPLGPALIADSGVAASRCYIKFFATNVRNPSMRRGFACLRVQ